MAKSKPKKPHGLKGKPKTYPRPQGKPRAPASLSDDIKLEKETVKKQKRIIRTLKWEIEKKAEKYKTPADRFVFLIQSGYPWHEAVIDAGINPEEAAKIIDQMLEFRRDGVAVFLLAERFLTTALNGLQELGEKSEDPKVKLLAYAKLADISVKVIGKKPWIEKIQAFPIPENAQDYVNCWDAKFEES